MAPACCSRIAATATCMHVGVGPAHHWSANCTCRSAPQQLVGPRTHIHQTKHPVSQTHTTHTHITHIHTAAGWVYSCVACVAGCSDRRAVWLQHAKTLSMRPGHCCGGHSRRRGVPCGVVLVGAEHSGHVHVQPECMCCVPASGGWGWSTAGILRSDSEWMCPAQCPVSAARCTVGSPGGLLHAPVISACGGDCSTACMSMVGHQLVSGGGGWWVCAGQAPRVIGCRRTYTARGGHRATMWLPGDGASAAMPQHTAPQLGTLRCVKHVVGRSTCARNLPLVLAMQLAACCLPRALYSYGRWLSCLVAWSVRACCSGTQVGSCTCRRPAARRCM